MFWFMRAVTVRLRGWRLYLLILAAAFFVAWGLMAAFEPPQATVADPRHYWWWFIVTAFTVGYGDYYPVSAGGRVGAFLVMFTTIGVLAALVNDLIEQASARQSKRLKGTAPVQAENHFVVVGYTPGRTERLARELCAVPGSHVVICAPVQQIAEHPMPDESAVSLVRGDVTDEAIAEQAALHTARAAIVDPPGGDDDKAALFALVINRINTKLHVVVAARDVDRMVRLLGHFGSAFECAEWHDVHMLSEAAHDPGITRFHADLKATGTGSDTHSLTLPDAVRGRVFGDLLFPLKEQLNATVCALGKDDYFVNNPPLSTPLEPGMRVYYISARRLAWKDVQPVMGRQGSGTAS